MVEPTFLSHHSGSPQIPSAFAFDSGGERDVFHFFLDGLNDLHEQFEGFVDNKTEVIPSMLIFLGNVTTRKRASMLFIVPIYIFL